MTGSIKKVGNVNILHKLAQSLNYKKKERKKERERQRHVLKQDKRKILHPLPD